MTTPMNFNGSQVHLPITFDGGGGGSGGWGSVEYVTISPNSTPYQTTDMHKAMWLQNELLEDMKKATGYKEKNMIKATGYKEKNMIKATGYKEKNMIGGEVCHLCGARKAMMTSVQQYTKKWQTTAKNFTSVLSYECGTTITKHRNKDGETKMDVKVGKHCIEVG